MKKTTLSAFKKVAPEAPKYPIFEYAKSNDIDDLIELNERVKNDAATIECIKTRLVESARSYYTEKFAGKTDAPKSMLVPNSDGSRNVMVTVTSKYPAVDEETLDGVLTKREIESYFESAWELKIKSSAIPEKRRQEFVEGLSNFISRFGLDPAQMVEAKEQIKPKAGFHESRLKDLSVVANKKLDEVFPSVVAVKVDGVK